MTIKFEKNVKSLLTAFIVFPLALAILKSAPSFIEGIAILVVVIALDVLISDYKSKLGNLAMFGFLVLFFSIGEIIMFLHFPPAFALTHVPITLLILAYYKIWK